MVFAKLCCIIKKVASLLISRSKFVKISKLWSSRSQIYVSFKFLPCGQMFRNLIIIISPENFLVMENAQEPKGLLFGQIYRYFCNVYFYRVKLNSWLFKCCKSKVQSHLASLNEVLYTKPLQCEQGKGYSVYFWVGCVLLTLSNS